MKTRIIIGLVLISTIIASCKKFLDPAAPSVYDSTYIFSTVSDANRAVNGVYALFNTDAFTSRVSNNFTGNNDIEIGGVGSSADGSRRDIWSFEATSAQVDLLAVWNNAYNAINKANECIAGIEASALYKANDPAMLHLEGECFTLRAYWYYLLVENWGDVPYKTTPSRDGDNFYLPKTDRNLILTNIINDLVTAEPKMKWADQLDYGIERINREFVMGLIARLSLTRGGYALYPDLTMKRNEADYLSYYKKANDYCRKLMTLKPHTLDPSYSNVFLNECKYIKPLNSDVLYEVAFGPNAGDVAWCNGMRVDAGPANPYGTGSAYLGMSPSYYHSFDTLDVRLPATCSIYYYSATLQQTPLSATSITPAKWNRILVPVALGTASSKGTGINWPLMRYSDVLLMLAETENEINGSPTGDAKNALKMVRQRAFPAAIWSTKVDAYINTVSASKQTFFDAIVNERAWEFGAECLRKYDLIRWNYYGKKVAEARNIATQMGIDANAGTGTYSNLPDVLYYKLNGDKTVSFLSRYAKVQGGTPTGWTALNWLRSLQSSGAPSTYITYSWRGYKDNSGLTPLNYMLPIASSIISDSRGTLKNDGYGFTN
ncbi:MAG: RagB/SusD family nutrient uptake outer membrane protein [Mucilaginibacter sp.]|uniref:RagB/SusD family nutrient uptake outer membrane protein n=1 Tax=Mucilaginibacter sp. TaxID=1882438 RepID=UPI0032647BEB